MSSRSRRADRISSSSVTGSRLRSCGQVMEAESRGTAHWSAPALADVPRGRVPCPFKGHADRSVHSEKNVRGHSFAIGLPARTTPPSMTRQQFMPRRRIAFPSAEFTKASASSPKRAENLEHPVWGLSLTSRSTARLQSRTGREVGQAEVHVNAELIACQRPPVHVARQDRDGPSVHQGDPPRHLMTGAGGTSTSHLRVRDQAPPVRSPRTTSRPSTVGRQTINSTLPSFRGDPAI